MAEKGDWGGYFGICKALLARERRKCLTAHEGAHNRRYTGFLGIEEQGDLDRLCILLSCCVSQALSKLPNVDPGDEEGFRRLQVCLNCTDTVSLLYLASQ